MHRRRSRGGNSQVQPVAVRPLSRSRPLRAAVVHCGIEPPGAARSDLSLGTTAPGADAVQAAAMSTARHLIGWAAAAAIVAYPAVAAATADDPAATVRAIDAPAPAWDPAAIAVPVGATVRWRYDDAEALHGLVVSGPQSYVGPYHPAGTTETDDVAFPVAGDYSYTCPLHSEMQGTLKVGDGTPSPTPSASPTATATATVTATPAPSATATPEPTAGPPPAPGPVPRADRSAPRLRAVRATAQRRGARVALTLDEPATVTLTARRRGAAKAIRRSRRLPAGSGAIALRLAPGRYALAVVAEDAAGNRSGAVRRTLRVRR